MRESCYNVRLSERACWRRDSLDSESDGGEIVCDSESDGGERKIFN